MNAKLTLLFVAAFVAYASANTLTIVVSMGRMFEFYNNPREGELIINIHGKDGSVESRVGGSQGNEIIKSGETYRYTVETSLAMKDIDGVGIGWAPKDSTSDKKIFPTSVFAIEGKLSVRLCRRKASDGVAPGGEYIFRRSPDCFKDQDQ